MASTADKRDGGDTEGRRCPCRKSCPSTRVRRAFAAFTVLKATSGSLLAECKLRLSPTLATIDDEAELQEQYEIDYHTLQSSLDHD